MSKNTVVVTDVHREYQQGEFTVKALQGVSLGIEPGEFTVLMGASGSGKTTLLNIIGGLDSPTSGSVQIDGQELASMVQMICQISVFINWVLSFRLTIDSVLSAFENTEFVPLMQGVGAEERRTRSMEMLQAVGLGGMEQRLPSELSGGQQQRVAVARALAGNPMLILADEPTANLDSTTGRELIALMRSLNEEKDVTFIFATHDPKVMEAAKRIIHLEDGKIIEDERR